jgi:hypothetical protein
MSLVSDIIARKHRPPQPGPVPDEAPGSGMRVRAARYTLMACPRPTVRITGTSRGPIGLLEVATGPDTDTEVVTLGL